MFKLSTTHWEVCLVRLASDEMMDDGVKPHWVRSIAAALACAIPLSVNGRSWSSPFE